MSKASPLPVVMSIMALDATPSFEGRPLLGRCIWRCIPGWRDRGGLPRHTSAMARKGKAKHAPQPLPRPSPSGLVVVLAFATAIGVAVALVVLAVVLRSDDESAAPTTPTPLVDLDGIPQDGIVLGSPTASV